MGDGTREKGSSAEVFRIEAEAEAARRQLCAESEHQLVTRCPDCDSLGSMELIDGVMRCVDCDEVVAARRQLPGFGRR